MTDPNSANYYYNDYIANGFNGGYAVNNSTAPPAGSALTDAGAFSLASSFYGTFDQGGNVWEWNEATDGMAARGMRGGSWSNYGDYLRASNRAAFATSYELPDVGFRVVIVPEPTVVGLMALGMMPLAWKRRRTL